MSKKILINTLIGLIILAVGIFIGAKLPRKVATSNGTAANTYQAGWDAARAKIAQSPIGMQITGDNKTVNGTIQSISGSKLTVKINQTDPLADPSLDVRTVTTDSSTKLFVNSQKDPAEFQKEMAAFQDQMKNQSAQPAANQTSVVPPMPFEKKDINLSDLKVGQQISVSAGSDISNQATFTAIEIDVQDITAPAAGQTSGNTPAQAPAPAAPAPAAPAANAPAPVAPSTK